MFPIPVYKIRFLDQVRDQYGALYVTGFQYVSSKPAEKCDPQERNTDSILKLLHRFGKQFTVRDIRKVGNSVAEVKNLLI